MSTDPELHALIDKADELLVRCERSLMRVQDKRREVELLERVFGGIDFLRPQPSLLAPLPHFRDRSTDISTGYTGVE